MASHALRQWLGSKHQRPDGSQVHIRTQFAILDCQPEKELARDLRSSLHGSLRVLLVHDQNTQEFAAWVERAVRDRGFLCFTHFVPNEADGSCPANTQENSLLIVKSMEQYQITAAVAVGAGTINDLTKYAAHVCKIPYMVYATAASMNGYNSPIAAMYVQGLKSSVPAEPALGMYADPEVIAKAPREMHVAGLGDLCSKPFAGADAAVANWIMGETPWRLPTEMVHEAFEHVLTQAERIGQDDIDAVACLMEALWISGFSMTLAGNSAPASGGEHLWSHLIDMQRHDAHLPHLALHGTQVGIACGLVRPLFAQAHALTKQQVQERMMSPLMEPSSPEYSVLSFWIEQRHPGLAPRSREALLKQAALKYNPETRRDLRTRLASSWEHIRQELLVADAHAAQVEVALQRAKAPRDPKDIQLSHHDAKTILQVCRDIRNRFTILDLTAELFGEVGLIAPFPFVETEPLQLSPKGREKHG